MCYNKVAGYKHYWVIRSIPKCAQKSCLDVLISVILVQEIISILVFIQFTMKSI